MSIFVTGGESYPGHDFSLAQLFSAVKQKLRGSMFGGRYVWNKIYRLSRRTGFRILQDFDDHKPNRGEVELELETIGVNMLNLHVSLLLL